MASRSKNAYSDRTQQNNRNRTQQSLSKKKRKQNALIYAVVLLIVLIAFLILSLTVFFNITTIEVSGSSTYSSDEIIAASKIVIGDNMLRENTKEKSRNVTSSLVYIEDCDIKRVFPSTLRLSVTPAVPYANVETINGYYIVSKRGKILEERENPQEGLLTVFGASIDVSAGIGEQLLSIDDNKTDVIYDLIDAIEDSRINNITQLDITDTTDISFVYDSRITVRIGVASDLDYKLQFVKEIITKEIGSSTSGTLRLLSKGAQFIDEAGLMENESVYSENIETYVDPDMVEETEVVTDENGNFVTVTTVPTEESESEEETAPEPSETTAPVTRME